MTSSYQEQHARRLREQPPASWVVAPLSSPPQQPRPLPDPTLAHVARMGVGELRLALQQAQQQVGESDASSMIFPS